MKFKMKNVFVLLCVFVFIFVQSTIAKEELKPYADYVNPLVGSDSTHALSTGNTYPAIALPWGMNFWTPQTNNMGNGWGYQYDAHKLKGFKQTHQPSPWINDYAAFLIMPIVGDLKVREEERESWFSHKAEISKPYYYSVYLADHDVTTEITPTERAAQFRFTFPESDSSYVLLDAFNKGSYVKIIPEERTIIGYCRNNRGGVPSNFHNYFIVVFDTDFEDVSTWSDWNIKKDNKEERGNHVGAVVRFKTTRDQVVNAKVSSSFISPSQARLNLDREIGDNCFDKTCADAKAVWNKVLGTIEVEGGTETQYQNFYTALYRAVLFPRTFHEFDKDNNMVHYSPYNGKVLPGPMFTDNGFWDTFRSAFPLNALLFPELNSLMMEGLANTYRESGWLPEWASPGHRGCMIGSNSASIIADSYMKGNRDYDIETLYEAIIKNTKSVGPITSVGRAGAEYYNELGYVPSGGLGFRENTARTLEYAYADYCIWQLAKELNRPQEEIDLFAKRAQNYRNVYDSSVDFMRGRNADGSWVEPFVAEKWGGDFTEGCSWHYTWSVFQDPQGLIDLMGGRDNFVAKLDAVFSSPPKFDDSYYGGQIHEITEMLISDLGQYAHGNQPIQHMIYLYNYAGAPYKAQKWIRTVMEKLYQPTPDGLCGDEDNGQTSAWYVFSALGFYSVCPGSNEYVIGAPLFKKATINLEDGKKFVVNAPKNSAENIYIQSASTGLFKKQTKTYLTHEQITSGGKIDFKMGSEPNKKWGASPEDAPYSMSNEN